ncbi:glycoside hydrolase/deacetylase [Microthyrium microscopicum]|uniref:Glycoside hydrolase/deacetylase n=1 Tax=Microthyrium microscopicum TaxID=703497 RepID=A0A6A6USX4_9PEZI|nr:glycoside hydrolase/deacetylase [Microthyrium microscopicum]
MAGIKAVAALSALTTLVAAHPGHSKRSIAVGKIISACTVKGQVALTFDDGPYQYTETILNDLDASGHKGTFFQNGLNYDSIYNYNSTVQRIYNGGHQVCSHTWDHADLATLTTAQIQSEMTQLEVAFANIIGVVPTYMRPPYLSTTPSVLTTLGAMGYSVIEVDIDTLDWEYDDTSPSTAEQNYQTGYEAGGSISLNHDPEPVTASTVLPWIINYLNGKGLKSVTVGECLGDPAANWYRAPNGAKASSSKPASASSTKPATSSTKPASSVSATVSKSASSVPASVSSKAASATASVKASSSSAATPTGKPSPDDTCGGTNGYVCQNSQCKFNHSILS